jgi:hypothetical protein
MLDQRYAVSSNPNPDPNELLVSMLLKIQNVSRAKTSGSCL